MLQHNKKIKIGLKSDATSFIPGQYIPTDQSPNAKRSYPAPSPESWLEAKIIVSVISCEGFAQPPWKQLKWHPC